MAGLVPSADTPVTAPVDDRKTPVVVQPNGSFAVAPAAAAVTIGNERSERISGLRTAAPDVERARRSRSARS